MGFVTVPGSIKQQYLPFLLNPDSGYGKIVDSSEAVTCGAQYFSFKNPENKQDYKCGFGRVSICPHSFTSDEFSKLFQEDISFRTLINPDLKLDFRNTKNQNTVWNFMNMFPSVQIREYIPDVRIDQLLNISKLLIEALKAFGVGVGDEFAKAFKATSEEGGKKNENAILSFFSAIGTGIDAAGLKVYDNLADLIQWLGGFGAYNGENPDKKSLMDSLKEPASATRLFQKSIYAKGKGYPVIDFPFMLYHKLQSYVTTNVYELPFKPDNAFNIDGMAGWKGAGVVSPTNSFIGNMLKKIPGMDNIMKGLFGNIRINYMSSWDSESGSNSSFPEFTVKFSLFNDTLENTLMNFIFINTIAPNNMWIQYGMLQHSSSVYDIKIDGHSRMFMCAGKVKIDYKGVLRFPSSKFLIQLVSKHLNKNELFDRDSAYRSILDNKLIKIPDVYEVELSFKSMFPANFNNYLYSFAFNNSMETLYMNGDSYYGGIFGQLSSEVTDFVAKNAPKSEKQEETPPAAAQSSSGVNK